jgi:hypothetical protein
MAALPIHDFRKGLIRVRIWRKRTKSGVRHSVTVVRLLRKNGVWNESPRFSRDDIPLVQLVLEEAHAWIFRNCVNPQKDNRNADA